MRPSFLAIAALSSVMFAHLCQARAGAPDPRTLRDQFEEQVLEGDRDLEDLAVFKLARAGAPSSVRAPAYIALEAFVDRRVESHFGFGSYGVFAVLQLPLERFAAPPPPARVRAPDLESEVSGAGFAIGEPGGVMGEVPNGSARESAPPAAGPIVVTAETARACVRAAWRTLGVADDARIDALGARARSSASLPELRVRVARTLDESGRLTLSPSDPDRYVEAGGASNILEARMTFRLDRLLFADDEIALERLRIERSEARSRIAAKALQTLFEWQRARALALDPSLPASEHFAAVLREVEAAAILDVMTDGWFGRFRRGEAALAGAAMK